MAVPWSVWDIVQGLSPHVPEPNPCFGCLVHQAGAGQVHPLRVKGPEVRSPCSVRGSSHIREVADGGTGSGSGGSAGRTTDVQPKHHWVGIRKALRARTQIKRERESCHAGNIGFSYFHCYTLGIYYLLIHTHMRDDASDSFDCTLFEEEPSLGGSQAVSGNWWQSTRMNLH